MMADLEAALKEIDRMYQEPVDGRLKQVFRVYHGEPEPPAEPRIEAGALVKHYAHEHRILALLPLGALLRRLDTKHISCVSREDFRDIEVLTPAEVEVGDTVMTPAGVALVLRPGSYDGFYEVHLTKGGYQYVREMLTILFKAPREDC